jgi:hypothetical protein
MQASSLLSLGEGVSTRNVDRLARVCAALDERGDVAGDDRVFLYAVGGRLAQPARDAGGRWTPRAQCEALAARLGPQWREAVIGDPARSLPYEEVLPPELQDRIMALLIEEDPYAAAAMAQASPLQASLLRHQAQRPTVAGLFGPGSRVPRPTTARQRCHAERRARLGPFAFLYTDAGGEEEGGGDTQGPSPVSPSVAMRAGASVSRSLGASGSRLDRDMAAALCVLQPLALEGIPYTIVRNEVLPYLDALPLAARVRALYGWLVGWDPKRVRYLPFSRYGLQVRDASQRLSSPANRDAGWEPARDATGGVPFFLRVGPQHEGDTAGPYALAGARPAVLDMVRIVGPYDKFIQAPAVDRSWHGLAVVGWYNGRAGVPIGSAEAEALLRDHIDARIRDSTWGPCRYALQRGRVTLPSFSRLFEGPLYLVPPTDREAPTHMLLVGRVFSPDIERILEESARVYRM